MYILRVISLPSDLPDTNCRKCRAPVPGEAGLLLSNKVNMAYTMAYIWWTIWRNVVGTELTESLSFINCWIENKYQCIADLQKNMTITDKFILVRRCKNERYYYRCNYVIMPRSSIVKIIAWNIPNNEWNWFCKTYLRQSWQMSNKGFFQ